jgi:hypothetical protein
MSEHVPAALAALVRERANDRCEYCWLPQATQEATFHLDHIRPRAAAGPTIASNLALACVTCSLRKAARFLGRDPRTGKPTPLFDPRRNVWADHFIWTSRWRLVGRTAIGRATIRALGMNRPSVVAIRQTLAALGRFSVG